MSEKKIDEAKVEAFAEKVLGLLNGSGVTLMLSVGHRTGLFDTMAEMPPGTSQEIADKAGLQERYVREWLGVMVTGQIVSYDAETKKYALPPEHAALLTRAAAPDNLAVSALFIPLIGSVEDQIVECFHKGGGVPYTAYERFHEVMAEDSEQNVVIGLKDGILPVAPGLIEKLEAGIDVLDVGCGRGRAAIAMAKDFPKSRFAGYDLSESAIATAKSEAERAGVTNVRFETVDMTHFEEKEKYDLITAFDAIHDQANPAKVLQSIAQALRPGGTYLMLDILASSHVHENIDHPLGPLLYTISCMHCMPVSLGQGGPGLGAMWGEHQAVSMLKEAGFSSVEVKQRPEDIQNNYYICTR